MLLKIVDPSKEKSNEEDTESSSATDEKQIASDDMDVEESMVRNFSEMNICKIA